MKLKHIKLDLFSDFVYTNNKQNHGDNTKIPTYIVEQNGAVSTCCLPRNVVLDRAERMLTEEVTTFGWP